VEKVKRNEKLVRVKEKKNANFMQKSEDFLSSLTLWVADHLELNNMRD
jgi:hypothetical protein